MTLFIKTDTDNGNILNGLHLANNILLKSMQKLASGLRINSAADDPAGLVISEQMRARIASLNREIENSRNMIDKYETASSVTLELRGLVTEMRSLALGAANDAVNDPQTREAYQAGINSLVNTFNDIAAHSTFGAQKLLDSSEGSVTTITPIGTIDISNVDNIDKALAGIDDTASRLDCAMVDIGAAQKNQWEAGLRRLQIESQNLIAAESQLRDTDYAREISQFIQGKLLLNSSVALLAHGYIIPQSVLSLITEKSSL